MNSRTEFLPVPLAPPRTKPRIQINLPPDPAPPPPVRGRGKAFKLQMFLAATAAFGVSILLVPRGQEMALLRLEAGDVAGARSVFELRYADGERSPAVIAALARTRARTGDLAGAIGVLEPMARERPGNVQVLEALLTYRRWLGGEPEKLLWVLTTLQAASPLPFRLREIADLHGQLGQTERQRAVLRQMLSSGGGEAQDYVLLARLEALGGSPMAGILLLRRLERLQPKAIDVHAAALLVALHVQAGQVEAGASAARDWLAQQDRATAARHAPVLASFLGVHGRPDLVVSLLSPLVEADAPKELVLALAQAEIDAGRAVAALNRLEALPQGEEAAGAATPIRLLRLRLALALGDLARAMGAAEAMGPAQVPPALLQDLAATALHGGHADILRRMLAWGGRDLFASTPHFAVEVAFLLGDIDAAHHWTAALTQSRNLPADPRRALALASVLMRIGRPDAASDVIAAMLAGPAIPADLLASAARSFVQMRRGEVGAAVLEQVRRQQPSIAADGAWALAAAAVPAREAELVAWLGAATGGEPFPNLFHDIMHVAADAGAMQAAVAATKLAVAAADSNENHLLLARRLMDAGRPAEALDSLRILRRRGVDEASLYEAALTAAWRQSEPVADELRAMWSARLAEAETDEARAAALASLAEFSPNGELLPDLRRIAAADPVRWLWTYNVAAARAGRSQDAASLAAELSQRQDLSTELRRQLAFGLLERGDRTAAEAAFRRLAATAPADSADVRQLLFVWGQRVEPGMLTWLEARARAAAGAEKAAWMRLLTERGGARNAIAAYQASANAATDGPAWDAYLTALSVAGDRRSLSAALRQDLRQTRSAERLRMLAGLAGQTGDAALEDLVLRALVEAGGGNAPARRRVGLAAFRGGEMALAERLLGGAAGAAGDDAEVLFILGEIRLRQGDPAGARHQHEAALRRIPATGRAAETRRLKATLLRRLGRNDEALPLYEALLAENPGDRHLRADLAALLIETRNFGRAQTVLAGR
jgi:tetratricopeptide (TPR) repeat protein